MQPQPPAVPPLIALLQRAARGRVWRVCSTLIVWAAIAGLLPPIGAFAQHLSGSLSDTPGILLGYLILLATPVVMAVLASLIREAARLALALRQGARVLRVVLGPLQLEPAGGRLRPSRNRLRNPLMIGAVLMPTRTAHLLRDLWAQTLVGPLLNLLTAGLALAALPLLRGTAYHLALLFGLVSLIYALVALLPMHTNGTPNGGAQLLDLWRGGPAAQRWCAVTTLRALGQAQRPRDWDRGLLALALALPDYSVDDLVAHDLAFSAALDRGDAGEVLRHITYLLAHIDACPAWLRPALQLEGAFFAARQGDWAAARAAYEQARGKLPLSQSQYDRVEAAVLLAEGQPAQALAVARRCLAALEREPQTGLSALEADLARELIRQSQADLAAGGASGR